MLILGIESSCDETGAAVVRDDGMVLSDVVQSQVDLHARYGGVVPELASRDHARNIEPVVREALARAKVSLDDLAGIAVTNRPGLVGALLVGVQFAKGLAWSRGLPLVGVDHLMGHLLAVFLRRENEPPEAPPPEFPFVALLASGGHTSIYLVEGPTADACRELGGTRDDAAGEAFDKVAKLLGLGYPGGPIIDRLAAAGDPARYPQKAPMSSVRSLEFSFSGIKSRMARHVADHGVPTDETEIAALCASFQKAVTEVLASKLVEAAQLHRVSRVVLGGGVAANRELRERTKKLASARSIECFLPPLANCTDNAAMIAYAGAARLGRGQRDGWDLSATSQTSLLRLTRKGRGAR